jgi:hypothetical protein
MHKPVTQQSLRSRPSTFAQVPSVERCLAFVLRSPAQPDEGGDKADWSIKRKPRRTGLRRAQSSRCPTIQVPGVVQ